VAEAGRGSGASLEAVARACEAARAQLILVPDTSVLLKNPDFSKWDAGMRTLIVISTIVVGELDNHKKQYDKRPDQAEAAGSVLAALASVADKHVLADGGPLTPELWVATTQFAEWMTPPGLNPKNPDHQIASVAAAVSLQFRGVPCLLLTNDNAQAVAASAAGIDHFRRPHPFVEGTIADFREAISRIVLPATD